MKNDHTQSTGLKIGLFGIGLDAYWDQFAGLKDRLDGYLTTVQQKLEAIHPGIVNAGLVDTSDKAFEAGRLFRRQDVAPATLPLLKEKQKCAPCMYITVK